MRQQTYYMVVFVVAMMCTWLSFAIECNLPVAETAAIQSFFDDFKVAVNAKDAVRVKALSGKTWKHWSMAINDKGVFDAIEILDFKVGATTNVVTKCTVIGDNGRTNSTEVIFEMEKIDGIYSIARMAVPEIDNQNQEFDDAHNVVRQLIEAINSRRLDGVKRLLSFGGSKEFDAELSARGLSWIKASIEEGVMVQKVGSGVSRGGKDVITGRLNVPCAPGGTNVLRKVIFKNGKIDRCAPQEESAEEIRKRVEQEKAEEQRNYENAWQRSTGVHCCSA
ncbi:MAG: hypothetical protein IJI73_05330 [Kiritimatiellae bacterium]|nr:hypothetical protein [Kiritimatiellia bacterium]